MNQPLTNTNISTLVSQAFASGQIPQAVTLLDSATELPDLAIEELTTLTQLAMTMGQMKAAMQFMERVRASESGNIRHLLQSVIVFMQARKQSSAMEMCGLVLEIEPQNTAALNMLANCYSGAGRFDEAESLFRNVLQIDPGYSFAIAGLAKCRRFTEDGLEVITLFKKALAHKLNVDAQARIHFAIAKIFNDLKEYESAWRHAANANMLLRMQAPFKAHAVHSAQIDKLMANHPISRPNEFSGTSKTEHLLIVGMPRSGTTLVEQMLAGHSAYYPGGEIPASAFAQAYAGPHFPVEMANFLSTEKLDLCAAAYERYFMEYADISGLRTINKVPYNYLNIGFFKGMFPNGKIIYMKRHPLDVVSSIFFEHFSSPMSYSTDINDILYVLKESERLMAHWLQAYPEDILTVEYERLASEPDSEIATICEFLGIAPQDLQDHTQVANAVETPSVWQVRQGVYRSSMGRWKRYSAMSQLAEKLGFETSI